MNSLESGLFLPIRFYWNISEQDRYKRHSLGVSLTDLNYVHVDCTTLAPFQISYMQGVTALGVSIALVCANGDNIVALPYNSAHWHEYIDDEGMYFLSYLGDDDFSSYTDNGLKYLIVTIQTSSGDRSWYSDLFMISNCETTPYGVEEFRSWVGSDSTNLRAIDATDLRIVK